MKTEVLTQGATAAAVVVVEVQGIVVVVVVVVVGGITAVEVVDRTRGAIVMVGVGAAEVGVATGTGVIPRLVQVMVSLIFADFFPSIFADFTKI